MRANPNKTARKNKQIKAARQDMCNKSVELFLNLMYSAMKDEKISKDKITAVRKRMDRYCAYIADDSISADKIIEQANEVRYE